MPYKRRLRLLLVAATHPEWAEQAGDVVARIGAELIEPRPVTQVGIPEAQWADLVVTLEAAARERMPDLPPRVRVRHLDLARETNGLARQEAVEEHIRGILGGLRLMERSDRAD